MPAYIDTGLNLIDVTDCARGHILAEEKGRPGERYILGNKNMSLKDILLALETLTGLKAPRIKIALLGRLHRRTGLRMGIRQYYPPAAFGSSCRE